MTDYQNELVMEHLDLVNWVIRTRISVPNRPLLTYDDFYAIGCEAICRAALKYQADSGEFAPFACRYIYNAIIDHCRAMNYRLQRSVDAGFEEGEVLFDLLAHTTVDFEAEVTDDSAMAALRACKEKYERMCEVKAAKRIVSMLLQEGFDEIRDLDEKIDRAEKNLHQRLAPSQRNAVKLCLSYPITIMTGGPGSGKTTTLRFILDIYQAAFPSNEILLAAPTGRASRRMSEQTGKYASTLHSALGLVTEEDSPLNDTEMLSADLIVVDEFSMVDMRLAYVLLERIKPGAQLIIVGDADQLPSVGAGNVLREMIRSEKVPTAVLETVFRQASNSRIITNAHAINHNLTSIDQYYGTQSKCCPHYVGVHEGDEVVCLTEGVMKADIAYSFALGTSYESGFVGLTGVPSYSQFERALEDLNSIGVVRINIMVDSDYQVKEEVRKARDRYVEMGVAAGFEVAPITWTQKRKGVDDLYKHLFRNK